MIQKLLAKLIGWRINLLSLIAPASAAKLAYRVFCRPPQPHVRAKELQFLKTGKQVKSRIADQDVLEYHWGPANGPLVILSYGWHYNAGRWRHFVPALEEAGFHVLAFDPPGHGLNPGNFLNVVYNSRIIQGLIDKYGKPEAMIGHSFGGASTVYALSHLPAEKWPKRVVIMASFSHAIKIFEEYRDALGLWPAIYNRLVGYVESLLGIPIQTFDLAYMSSRLTTVQALLVQDPSDPVTPFGNALRYQAYWPQSRLMIVNRAGHHLGKPEVTEAILTFAIQGRYPEGAESRKEPLAPDHDLVRFFAGVDIG